MGKASRQLQVRGWAAIHSGDVALAAGGRETARDDFQHALDIAKKLAADDPGNAVWQRDLGVVYSRIGDVALAAGERETARDAFQHALDIFKKLTADDPGNAVWQRNLG